MILCTMNINFKYIDTLHAASLVEGSLEQKTIDGQEKASMQAKDAQLERESIELVFHPIEGTVRQERHSTRILRRFYSPVPPLGLHVRNIC